MSRSNVSMDCEAIKMPDQAQPPVTGTADIDLAALALPQDFTAMAPVKQAVVAVPIQKPGKQVWFSPHPDHAARVRVAVMEDEQDRKAQYIVAGTLWECLEGEWVTKVLVPCQTRQGAFLLWPIRLPDRNGKLDPWNTSALAIADQFGGRWMRLRSNMELGHYEACEPVSPLSAPDWPEDMGEVIRTAMKGRVIDTMDHPLLKRLRGED